MAELDWFIPVGFSGKRIEGKLRVVRKGHDDVIVLVSMGQRTIAAFAEVLDLEDLAAQVSLGARVLKAWVEKEIRAARCWGRTES